MLVCIYAPEWPADLAGSPLPAELLTIVPRVTIASDVVWADARGLNARDVALALISRVHACGVNDVRAGVARVAITAELAAKTAQSLTVVVVEGDERSFLAPMPLQLFPGHERLLTLLDGVGVRTCADLAALDREAIEVRFGAEAVDLWLLCRAQDERRVFTTPVSENLQAGTDFIDYVVTDPERLIFVANGLFATVCDQLRARGQHARRVMMTLPLANRMTWQRMIRPARPTASRAVWLRMTRALLERLTVPDAVTGLHIEVIATEVASAVQGDLFDTGFATASAVEGAVARLIEMQGNVIVAPETTRHPRVEKRTHWLPETMENAAMIRPDQQSDAIAGMQLRLLPEAREVLVETVNRRDHIVPVRFRDGQWRQLVNAAGPDRISGGKWDDAYAREYFRAVTVEGQLVWLYRDARNERWFLHGYWD